jgi:S1-C subfamily serine protease
VAHAGLRTGDVILTIAGSKIASEEQLREAIRKIGPGKTDFSFRRGNETKNVTVNCSQCKVE